MKKIFLCFAVIFALSGCDVVKQIGGAYNLSQCEYNYNSISNLQIAGINLGNGGSIPAAKLASIATILSGGGNFQNIPLSFSLNMDVKNPNPNAAFLNALDYSVIINDLEFTQGKMDIPIRIEPGQSQIVPLNMTIDLKNLMDRYSQPKVASTINAFLGITPSPTTVKVNIWPKVMVGNTPIKSPAAIPIIFNFGGK